MFDPITSGASASAKTLAQLCDRVALSLSAGIDVRRVWKTEATRLSGRGARACADVANALAGGDSLDAAIAANAPYFPPLVVEMVRVGEQTGTTEAAFHRLSDHYRRQVARMRQFRRAITWPAIQFGLALLVVAGMIGVGGLLNDGKGKPIDFLGLGLVGERGLLIFVSFLMGVALVVGMTFMAFRRRPAWGDALRGFATGLPGIGSILRTIALGRIAWVLRLVMNVDMDVRKAASLVLRASGNRRYARHAEQVAAGVDRGEPLSTCLARTREFPGEFLDALRVGEESGMIVETMDRVSREYDERAQRDMEAVIQIAAFAVWLLVASLIVLLIFRVFSFYTGMINEALEGL